MKDYIDTWNKYLFEHTDDINAGAGILLFNSNGEVLLSKRSEIVSQPLTIGTIGGHLTKGEPPVIGAKREFYEESGYDGPFHNLQLLYVQKKDDGFTYYTFIAYTEDSEREFNPLPEFEKEILWNRWLDFELIKDSENLHPELKNLFSNSYVKNKIEEFLEAIP